MIWTLPFSIKKTNYQHIMNESVILTVACLLFLLTELGSSVAEDLEGLRIRLSWSIIVLILTCLIINLCIVIYDISILLKKQFKECFQSRASKYDVQVTEL